LRLVDDFGGQDFGQVQPEPARNQLNQGNDLHIQYKKYLRRKEIAEEGMRGLVVIKNDEFL